MIAPHDAAILGGALPREELMKRMLTGAVVALLALGATAVQALEQSRCPLIKK